MNSEPVVQAGGGAALRQALITGFMQFFGVFSPQLLTIGERRRQLLISIVIALPVTIVFSFFNFGEGFLVLGAVELSAGVLLLLAAWLQAQGEEWVTPAEWLGLLWGLSINVALVLYGGIEGTGVLWIFAMPFFAFFLKGQRVGWIFSGLWIVACYLASDLGPALPGGWPHSDVFAAHLAGAMFWDTCIAAAFNLARVRFMLLLVDARERAELANTTKSRFLASVSHDLRHPLLANGLFVDALAHTALSDEQKHYVRHLESSNKAMGEMLNSLLAIAKLDAGAVAPSFECLPVRELVGWIEAEFASVFIARQLRFKLFYPVREFDLRTDVNLVRSMLRNLLANALKFCDRGGVLVSIRCRGGRALIEVWDTGIGIADSDREHLFEEFFQVGNEARGGDKGIGLGLPMVLRQGRLIGARVGCRSRLGKGSVFFISLPLCEVAKNAQSDQR